MKYIIYKFENCCDPVDGNPQFHQVINWEYTPSAGGNVYAVENTYYNGDPLKYIWISVDDSELDGNGKLKGDLDVNIRCIDPCYLSTLGNALWLNQIGGFGMPESVGTFPGLNLDNCTGPDILVMGPPEVNGVDVPFGAAIRVQTFGGFGVTRRWNASNTNLTGFTKPIVNRITTEVNNSTDGYFVPWLRDMSSAQVAAGKKFIFQRKYGEGNHVFEFVANKVGPSLFSVMDEAACIRYWAVNVVASHCWDWTAGGISVENEGAARATVDTSTKVTSLNEFNDTASRATFTATKSNILPQEMDADLVEKYYIQNNSTRDSFCDCTMGDTKKGNEKEISHDQKAGAIESISSNAPVLHTTDDKFIQASRLFKGDDQEKDSDLISLQDTVRTIVRNDTVPHNNNNSRYLYVGESEEFNLPTSLYQSAATDEEVPMKGGVLRTPFISSKWDAVHKGEGYSADNTGPIAWTENDDRKIIKAVVPKYGDSVELYAISTTNFLPARIEIYHRSNKLWKKGEDFYRYFAPPVAKRPKKIQVSETDPDEDDPAKPFARGDKIGESTNNDTEETNYLEAVDYGSDRISWTQSAVFVAVVAMCPPVDIKVESKPPWANEAEEGYEIYDYGEGTEFKFKVEFPLDFNGTVAGERFHVAEPDYAHPKNSFFGLNAPIDKPKNGNWGNPDETGLTRNTSIGESDFSKTYVLNSRLGDNKRHHNASSISIFCSWRSGTDQIVYGKHPVYSFTRMGPGSIAGNEMDDDEWFAFKNDEFKIFFGADHIAKEGTTIKAAMKRGFGDMWRGVDEQLRGCNCMYRNRNVINLKREAPIIAKDGEIQELMIKDKNNIDQGIIFRGHDEEKA